VTAEEDIMDFEKTSLRESGSDSRIPGEIKNRYSDRARIIPDENKSHKYISGIHGEADTIKIIPKHHER